MTRQLRVEDHTGLVHTAVQRYRPALAKASGLDEADLIQAGLIGIAKAIARFDPARGTAFSTYAMHWVRHEIRRALSNCARTIRVPVWRLERGHAGVPTVSLNTPTGDGDCSLLDFVAAPEADDEPDEGALRARLAPYLGALETREPRLAFVVRERLRGRTLKQIGEAMQPPCSRERVRQIEQAAVAELRRLIERAAKRRRRAAA